MEESFYEKIIKIITEASYNTTYKMAYAKALIDIAHETEEINDNVITIYVNQIAEKFLEYYWNEEMFCGLNQSSNSYRTPMIVRIVQNLMATFYDVEREKIAYKDVAIEYKKNNKTKNAIREISITIKNDVFYRFININGKPNYDIYTFDFKDSKIEIKAKNMMILKEKYDSLTNLIEINWKKLITIFNKEMFENEYVNLQELNDKFEPKNIYSNENNNSKKREDYKDWNLLYNNEYVDYIDKVEIDEKYYNDDIYNYQISNKLRNVLEDRKIKTSAELLKKSREYYNNISSVGAKTLKEIDDLKNFIIKDDNLLKENLAKYALDKDKTEVDKLCEKKLRKEFVDNVLSQKRLRDDKLIKKNILYFLERHYIYTEKELIEKDMGYFEKLDGLNKPKYSNIYDYKKYIVDKYDLTKKEDNSEYLYETISNICSGKPILYAVLYNYLKNYTNYPLENLNNDINTLRTKNRLTFATEGIKILKIPILEYIESNFKGKERIILIERLKGKTLEEVGNSFKVTRERIRQIEQRCYSKIPDVKENNYKGLYEEYKFNLKEFTELFDEPETTYYYLYNRYKSGDKRLYEALKDNRFNEIQKEKIRNYNRVIISDGEEILLNKTSICDFLVKKYCKETTKVIDFINIYNKFLNDYKINLPNETEEKSMEGILSRLENTIFTTGKRFRYYDYYDIDREDYKSLIEAFNLEDGYYSTLLIFNGNSELMENINIKDEYELHNLIKTRLNNKLKVNLDRMPNFSIGNNTKKEYFEKIILKYAPINVEDLLSILEEDYGHKRGTIASYIKSEFGLYIKDGIISLNLYEINEEEKEKIIQVLDKDFYTIEELKEILKNNDFNDIEEIINNRNMKKIGYNLKSGFILKTKYNNIEQYMRDIIDNSDFIENYNFLSTITYIFMMKKFEKNLDIFLISKNEYITIKKLNKLNITKKDIEYLIEKIKSTFKDVQYFSVQNVYENIELGKIEECGFDDVFYNSIIKNIDEVKYSRVAGGYIFSLTKEQFDVSKFIEDCVNGRNGVSIDDLLEEIQEKYGINVDRDKTKLLLRKRNLFYSDELEKIYQDKSSYYEEVYSNEQ